MAMDNGVLIRTATEADVPKIVPIWQEMMNFHAKRDLYFAICEGAEEAFSGYLSENIEKKDAAVFIAQDAERVISYCLCLIAERPPVCEMKRQYGNLSDLAVVENYRRKGVGEQMTAFAMKWFQSRELERVEVRVAVTNEISTQFWRKMGFQPYIEAMYKQV